MKRGLFQCFGCQAKGNLLEFAVLMENLDPQNSGDFFKAASKLKDQFLGGSPQAGKNPQGSNGRVVKGEQKGQRQAKPEGKKNLPVIVNAPLDFELKNLDPKHPYLFSRGFTESTIEHFGLGFCSRGSLKDRIAIPLHDTKGKLIGYAGRVVDDEAVSAENPKYLFPAEREREGKTLRFAKSVFCITGLGSGSP